MATKEVPLGNGIKDISVLRNSTYIKIAKNNRSRLLPGRSILSIANSIPSVFKFSPSLCLKFKTSFSGDNGEEIRLAMMTRQARKKANGKGEGDGDWEREGK